MIYQQPATINMMMGPDGAFYAADADAVPTAPEPLPVPPLPVPPTAAATEAALQQEARRMLYTWGLGGVALGAMVSAGIAALSFGSYRRTGSTLGPALWAGGSSIVLGSALLLVLARQLKAPDGRMMAAAIGAQLAS